MDEATLQTRFRREILVHLDAAFNLARWLAGSDPDAQDIVQDAMLRAYQSFDRFRGDNARAWLLTIVRNCCYTWRQSRRRQRDTAELDESADVSDPRADPGQAMMQRLDSAALHAAIAQLPAEYREAIVLREFEQLDYKQIAAITDVPMGTVMSRLARARERLRTALRPAHEAD